jgi:cytochrome P450
VPYRTVVPDSVDDINLLDADLQNCPYAAYSLLRSEAPVWRDPKTGFFVISRFEDVRRVLLDPKRFSSQTYDRRAERILKMYQDQGWVPAPTLAGRDDPNHKQMRAMFNEAFRPKKIRAMEPFVEATTRNLFDAFIGKGYCDWMRELAVPLPLTVIGRQMGVPEADIWKIKAWTDAWVQRASMMQNEEQERWSVGMEIQAQHYFQSVFERLRTTPDDTLLSDMVNRVIPEWGRPLNDNELHAEMMADTFVGGSETSTNAIAYGMKLLIENPHIWSQLKADPDKYMKSFVEEVVRLEGPVQGLMRITTCDVEMQDVMIPEGSIVNIRFASANRDDDEFDRPAEIDLERSKPGRHLGFGSGIHHCLGAPLARRELYWAFTVLVERIEDMWFAEGKNDFTQAPSFALRALRELHIEFKPN